MSAVGKWFVMLLSQNGENIIPLTRASTEDVALFKTESAARNAGSKNPMGYAFGFLALKFGEPL